jgi:hypothetical protein
VSGAPHSVGAHQGVAATLTGLLQGTATSSGLLQGTAANILRPVAGHNGNIPGLLQGASAVFSGNVKQLH